MLSRHLLLVLHLASLEVRWRITYQMRAVLLTRRPSPRDLPAILGNPLFLVKARMQAYSPFLKIGKSSYHYSSTFDGLRNIVRTDGLRGLARGMDAAILRTAMGSSVQLPSYNYAKAYLVNLKPENTFSWNPLLLLAGRPDSFWTYLASSTFSGLCVCAVMQPADTALSRVYNQPTMIDGGSNKGQGSFASVAWLTKPLTACRTARGKSVGTLYRGEHAHRVYRLGAAPSLTLLPRVPTGPLHCLYLTAKTEGPLAWYKGTTAHLARIAPHTVLTLVANEGESKYCVEVGSCRLLILRHPLDVSPTLL